MARTIRAPAPLPAPATEPAVPVSVLSLAAPKQRRPSWVLLGALLVGVAALLGAWVFAATSERMSVVVAGRDLQPGEVIDVGDLRVVEMGRSAELRAVLSSQQDLLIGRAARGPIPAGTVLNTDLVGERAGVIPPGMVVVGAALEPGAAPVSGLSAGDRVQVLGVVKTTATGAGTVGPVASLLAAGSVWSVEPAASGSVSSKLWVSILVPADTQPAVAQAAADGRLRLSLVGVEG